MDLELIKQEICKHPSNEWARAKGYEPIYTASESARIVIIGQAPGRKAQDSKIPWNDVSGQKLREWLGMTNEQFYDESLVALIPMDFYFPGKGKSGDLPPRKDFAPMWHSKILSQMPNVRLIILIGQYAQKYYLGESAQRNLTETVRHYSNYLPDYLPIVHPSPLTIRWRKQNPWFEEQVLPELQKIVSDATA